MKLIKIISILFLILLFIPKSFGFEISQKKLEKLEKIKEILNNQVKNHDIDYYQKILNQVSIATPKQKDNEENTYILTSLKSILEEIIAKNYTTQTEDSTNTDFKTNFYNTYSKNILGGNIEEKCIKYYDFIDEIAKENDFPTPLIIAIWKVEGGCNLSNPNNGWGPFQITSQYYNPGKISLDDFSVSIKNYIDFSKNKINNYNNNKKLQTKYNHEEINISYNNYNINDLKIYSALYNGLKNKSSLDTSLFINGNFSQNLKSKTDGVITLFLKVLKYELDK